MKHLIKMLFGLGIAALLTMFISCSQSAGPGGDVNSDSPSSPQTQGNNISIPWACIQFVGKCNPNEYCVYMRYLPEYTDVDTGQRIELSESDITIEFLVGTGTFNPDTWTSYRMNQNTACCSCGNNLEYYGTLEAMTLPSGTKFLCRIRLKNGQWLYCYKRTFNHAPVPLSQMDDINKFTLEVTS